jgi:hypothetical protein
MDMAPDMGSRSAIRGVVRYSRTLKKRKEDIVYAIDDWERKIIEQINDEEQMKLLSIAVGFGAGRYPRSREVLLTRLR